MKKMTKAERIYEATRRECKDIITGIHGYSEGQRLSGLVTEEVVCMRTINAIMKLVDKEEHSIRLDEELGVLSGEKLQLYINVNKMVRSTVENVKKSLKKFLDDLNPDSEYSKWLDERVAAMEAQETTTAPDIEETAETAEQETVEGISKTETTTEMDDSGFEYYTVGTAYEAAETEPAKTPKSENVPYKMKWTNQNVDYSRANYTAVIFKFNNSKVWLQLDCVCSTQTVRATIRKLGKWFGSKSVDVKYFSDQTNEKIVSVCQLYDNSGYIFRNEIAVKNGEKRQFIKYAAKEIFE